MCGHSLLSVVEKADGVRVGRVFEVFLREHLELIALLLQDLRTEPSEPK